MCTATWILGDGLDLFFNRDERRTREHGEPPAVRERGGVRFLSPLDPSAGGSWILANEAGVVAAILNRYDSTGWSSAGTVEPRSRGMLLVDAAVITDLEALGSHLADAVERAPYAPFHLLGLQPAHAPEIWGWDGRTLEREPEPAPPVTTAGPESARLGRIRAAAFERMRSAAGGISVDLLERYHRGDDSDDRGVSVCLSRPEAWTVSRTRVQVDAEVIRMWYWHRRPDGSFEKAVAASLDR